MDHIQDIERLICQVEESADPGTKAGVRELVQAILEFHGVGLSRIVELSGEQQVRELARDEAVAPLLLLYGLHPDTLEVRVRRAVDKLQGVDITAIEDGVVRVKTDISRETIEQALFAAAPEIAAIDIETTAASSSFVPLEALFTR
jgi:hypothetical protein